MPRPARRKSRPRARRHRPVQLVAYQKDAVIRYKANPDYWGGKAAIDDLVFAITPDASVRYAEAARRANARSCAYPEPGRPRRDEGRPDGQRAAAGRPQRRLSRLQHRRRSRSTTRASARRSTWRSTSRRSSTRSSRARAQVAKNPIPPTIWSYNNAVKDDPYDPEAAKKLLAEAGVQGSSRSRSGRCRCSAPTTRTPGAWPS